LAGLDLSAFLRALSGTSLVLHGADYDLRMLNSSFDFRPQRDVFDTMLAAQLLGYEQFSLAALVERFFDVPLSKRGQKSDWSKRPLSLVQLEYARNDTKYLEPLAEMFQNEMDKRGRSDWLGELCDQMVQSALQEKPQRDPDKTWRIKGWTKLEQRQLLFLRELWSWRDTEARKVDLPSFKIMNNQQLVDLAVWAASDSGKQMENGSNFPKYIRGRRLAALKTVLRRTRGMPKTSWPGRTTAKRTWHEEPDYRSEIGTLQTECAQAAEQLGIAPSFLASRATLERLIRRGAVNLDEMIAHGPMMRWQAEALAPRILPLLKKLHTGKGENDIQ